MKRFLILAVIGLAGCTTTKNGPAPSSPPPQISTASSSALATPAAAPDLEVLSCTKGKETRKLQVSKKTSGCSLEYTKFGKTNSPASSTHGIKHCVDSKEKVRKHLEASGLGGAICFFRSIPARDQNRRKPILLPLRTRTCPL